MMFVGGEVGMEDAIARVNSIRATRPELWEGERVYGVPASDCDELYILSHRRGDRRSIVMVNLSPHAVSARLALEADSSWLDLLAEDEKVVSAETPQLDFDPFQARFLVAQ
jgi:hypothetical protein